MANKALTKILSNITWLVGEKVLDVILRVTVGVLVARYLGVESFGLLHFSLAIVALFYPVVKLGLTSVLVKRIVLNPEQKELLLGTAFFMQFVSSVLVGAVLLAVVYFVGVGQETSNILVSVLAITLIFQSCDPIKSWNNSQLTSKYNVLARRISLAIGLTIKMAFIHFGVAFIYFVWAWVIESILKACFYVYYYQKYESIKKWKFDRKIAVNLLKESWPMMFSAVATVIYLKIDVVMMGSLLDAESTGLYSAATRISELFYFIPAVVTLTLLPAIVRSSQMDESAFNERLQAMFDMLALYSLIVVAFLWLGADLIVDALFGSDFSGAGVILKIHAMALLFVASGASISKILIAENRMVAFMLFTVLGAVINVSMNLYLIPRYGGVGAALATVVSYSVTGYVAYFFWQPTTKYFKMMTASFLVFTRPLSLYKYLLGLRSS